MLNLEQLIDKISQLHAENKSIECVFDLDSTLFNVSPRSQEILHEFSDVHKLHDLKKIQVEIKDWGLKEAIERAGFHYQSHEDIHLSLIQFWRERFFSNEYVHYDTPYKGAVRFTQYLYDKGITVSYLTGRDIPRMQKGTIEVLKKWGFPYQEEHLHMKPYKEMNDRDYKLNWFLNRTQSTDQNKYYFFFENEPVNINAVGHLEHSQVHVVCMNTTHSRKDIVRVPHTLIDDFYIEGL